VDLGRLAQAFNKQRWLVFRLVAADQPAFRRRVRRFDMLFVYILIFFISGCVNIWLEWKWPTKGNDKSDDSFASMKSNREKQS
jgi:hypothetical protein